MKILSLSINLVPLLWYLDASFFAGLILATISAYSENLFRGRIGRILKKLAEKSEPAFVIMLPLEIFYVIGFVAIAIQTPYVWDRFQLFFLPGLFGILLLFTWTEWKNTAWGISPVNLPLLRLVRDSAFPLAPSSCARLETEEVLRRNTGNSSIDGLGSENSDRLLRHCDQKS
jgi:hypothetical protein